MTLWDCLPLPRGYKTMYMTIIFKHLPLRHRLANQSEFSCGASLARGNEQLCFLSGQVRTPVAMATYSSNRLIMGKEEIDIFSVSKE